MRSRGTFRYGSLDRRTFLRGAVVVFVDDKIRILSVVKSAGDRELRPCSRGRGHYALDPSIANYPKPDVSVDVGDLLGYEPSTLVPALPR